MPIRMMKILTLGLWVISAILQSTVCAQAQEDDAAEMARKSQDPLAYISALMTENDFQFNTGDDKTSYSFQLQPVYAFDFAEQGFSFIPRGIIPIIGAAPQSDLPGLGEPRPEGGSTTWGLGDVMIQTFFAPKTDSEWKWGVGPQMSFETRTDDKVGGPGWGAGVSAVLVGNLSKQISSAFIANQLWSFDGDFSTMGLQPNIFYNFESLPGTYVGYNGMVSADWKADSDDRYTLPLGFVVGKMFSLGGGYGIETGIGPYWNVVKPDGGADWSIKFMLNFLFPK
jgi:hypothetical protein